jgi:predicted DNA-binding protein
MRGNKMNTNQNLGKFLTVRISNEQSARLEALSEKLNLNKSNIVRLLITHFVNGKVELVLDGGVCN